MKKYLLPKEGNYYKANLHSHSNYSSGCLTPEEMKKVYKEHGYSVLACTDHNILLKHNELTDEDFLMLNGIEISINEEIVGKELFQCKTCHFCLIAPEPDFDESLPEFKKEYTAECISKIMKYGMEKGFFVTYNHPTWSMESYPQYINYHNMNAMEIYNNECIYVGHDEHNSRVYDDMLRNGERIYCIASDDNHNRNGLDDSFGGFTMIKADKPEYKAIINALKEGNFYASEGPVINDLWIEDSKVHITFEPAREVFITKGIRKNVRITEEGELCSAVFDITEDDIYFRITVVGHGGKKAYTNAYFTDEILK